MLDKVKKILTERILLDSEDYYNIEKYREKLIKILSLDKEITINILQQLNKVQVLYASEVFEEISANLNSYDYFNCLILLEKKFPDINIKISIEEAKKFMH